MWAMIVKEFRQLRRDRRTLAMMIVMPVVLLIVFGYAASFDVTSIPTVATGTRASQAAGLLGEPFDVVSTQPSRGRAWAEQQLRDGHAAMAVVTGTARRCWSTAASCSPPKPRSRPCPPRPAARPMGPLPAARPSPRRP
jgi:hypothetical protein